MRAREFITETWPVAVAKWFDILRKSQKFKHLPDDKIQQMATRAAQREVAPAQKATTPKQSLKDRFNQHRQEMSDEEFQDYYGFGKWDESVCAGRKKTNEASGGLPVKTLKGLYHVGTLDASKKRDGYEGAGLSVSTHPDAWERIARGHVTGDTYSATKEGNRFLDAHSLTKKHNAEITQWAIKNGYLEQQETVTVCYYDDEMEDNLCQTFDSMADAKNEYDDELQYMDVTVDKDGIVPTEKLKKETRQTRMSATGILEYVLPIFAEQQGLDGVWWQDKLDVQRYSAPRGVIVPSKIKSWKFTVNENLVSLI